MIKNLSVILISAALLSACGGSDNKSPAPVTPPASSSIPSSVVSSMPASSSSPASQAPVSSSSAPASSSSAPASSSVSACEDEVVNIYPGIDSDSQVEWAGNWQSTLTFTDSNDGLVVSFLKGEESIVFKQPPTTKLGNAIFELEFQASPEFKESGGFFEIMAQENGNSYQGKYLAISNEELTTDATNILSITLDDTALFDKVIEKQLGLMAKDPADGVASGTVTITSATLTFPNTTCASSSEASDESSSDASSAVSSSASSNGEAAIFSDSFASGISSWAISGSNSSDTPELALTHNSTLKALTVTPKNWSSPDNWRYSIRYTFPTPLTTAGGKTATFVMSIPQVYIDQSIPFQIVAGSSSDQYSNYLSAETPVDGNYTFTLEINETAGANLTFIGFQLATLPSSSTSLSPITVHSVTIQ